jgi:L,D-transpeptidase YcbB
VTQRKWTGAALALALCNTALASCSVSDSSKQSADSNASGEATQIQWNSNAEKQLRNAIAGSPAHGLKPELFLKGDSHDDAALTAAALRYGEALAHGYSDPTKLWEVYTVPRPKTDDLRNGLNQAIRNGSVDQWLASLAPQTDEYKALSQAHMRYLQQAGETSFQGVPAGDPIKPGAHDPRLPAVAAALRTAGYLNSPPQEQQKDQAAQRPTSYTPMMVAAVKAMQADFGLKTDGIIGGDTLDALNAGPSYRARQTAIAMERLRWLEREPPKTRIDVNTAAAFLDFWRDGQHIDHRKVVLGEPERPTPQLQSPIYRLVTNPDWVVPDSIESEVEKKGAAWMRANDVVMKNGRYVQQPGPKNSLGIVKFDMRNDQSIYLHDTPAKALFGLADRHQSHGCVRVENALQFATAIAHHQGVLEQFKKGLAKRGDESFIALKEPIVVRLLYHTAFWDGQRVRFRPDYYGWDANVARALGLEAGPVRKIPQPEGEDIGP